MQLIERYVYAVTRGMQEKQKLDIERELRGLIEDMLEDRLQGREPSREDVEQVLLELGNPRELAAQYRGYKRYLISPELFPSYLTVLKIVLISISIAMLVAFCIEIIIQPLDILEHFINTLLSFMGGLVQGFAWVTISFAIIEYAGAKKDIMKSTQSWKITDLPELPDHRSAIKRSDPITSIIFTILIAVVLAFSLDWIGVWRLASGESTTVIPIFDHAVLSSYLPYVWILLAFTLLKDCLKLITARWTVKLLSLDILISVFSLVLFLILFSDNSVWNASFIDQFIQTGLASNDSENFQKLIDIWDASRRIAIYVTAIIILSAIGASCYKLFKIANNK